MKQIHTPNLIRIPDPARAPVASLEPKAFAQRSRRRIDPPNHTQKTSGKNSYDSNKNPTPAKNIASRSITSAGQWLQTVRLPFSSKNS
jgi:hypothetical protein